MKHTILVADDDTNTVTSLEEALVGEGFKVLRASNGTEGIELVRTAGPDLILTDLMMPGMDGLVFLKTVKKINPYLPVIIITGHGSVETAVVALKEGAFDYLSKPIRMKEVLRQVSRAFEVQALQLENVNLKKRLRRMSVPQEVVGKSPAFSRVVEVVRQVAPTKSTVLLSGESGTGKEVVTNLIHGMSARSDEPLVKVNCAAIPETLLEAELFGYEKGSFTGATHQKIGQFETAHGGTIFLDEVADMSLTLQAKLLRCLQEGELKRVGGTETISIDVRLVAATNQNLLDAIAEKRFREDLYYRLNVISIHLPPLRERQDDIPLLAGFFIKKYASENKKKISGISQDCLDTLTSYHWPGNIRELENVVEQMVVMTRDQLLRKDGLPSKLRGGSERRDTLILPLGSSMEAIETAAIQETLAMTGGNKEEAAAILGIHVATLYRKLSALDTSQNASENSP
jgi:two-component system response regulator HydG